MVKIKEGFKGERLVSLPEELLASYRWEPLISNLYVRKIGFFPRVKYHFLQKEQGCDYAMLIYCTEGKGWYRILGKQYTVEKYQYIIIPPGIPYSFGADEGRSMDYLLVIPSKGSFVINSCRRIGSGHYFAE